MENKKTLILSIIGILVLVIAVVGVSFAMYTFAGVGTKQNKITTGSISLNITGPEFSFDGTYPMSDAKGILSTGNTQTVTVSANWPDGAPVEVQYDLGLQIETPTGTLGEDDVKILVFDEQNKVVVGKTVGESTATEGTLISDLAGVKGPNQLIQQYGIAGGTFVSSTDVDTYTVKAWVSDQYTLPVDPAKTTSPEDATGTMNNEEGKIHQKETASNTFKFKVIMSAKQV